MTTHAHMKLHTYIVHFTDAVASCYMRVSYVHERCAALLNVMQIQATSFCATLCITYHMQTSGAAVSCEANSVLVRIHVANLICCVSTTFYAFPLCAEFSLGHIRSCPIEANSILVGACGANSVGGCLRDFARRSFFFARFPVLFAVVSNVRQSLFWWVLVRHTPFEDVSLARRLLIFAAFHLSCMRRSRVKPAPLGGSVRDNFTLRVVPIANTVYCNVQVFFWVISCRILCVA